jgi:hypothetical protein
LFDPSIGLASPDYRHIIVTNDGYNSDIIKTLNNSVEKAVEQCKGVRFSGDTLTAKARAIYNYITRKVQYRRDDNGKQIIQLPARMIRDTKKGDCKSMALAAAAFMICNGFKNVRLRYAGYRKGDTTPSHVYAVGSDELGRDIIIDPVYKQFNKEANYTSKKDYKVMEISVLSGIGSSHFLHEPLGSAHFLKGGINSQIMTVTTTPANRDRHLRHLMDMFSKVKSGTLLSVLLHNEIGRITGSRSKNEYPDSQVRAYAKYLTQVQKKHTGRGLYSHLMAKELQEILAGNFKGDIYSYHSEPHIRGFIEGLTDGLEGRGLVNGDEIGKLNLRKLSIKKVLHAAKMVAFAPTRRSFLTLVSLNVFGLAYRLYKLKKSALHHFWVDQFGGRASVIDKAVHKGARKKPLFSGRRIHGIEGPETAAAATTASGGSPHTLATIIATATPIILGVLALLKKHKVEDVATPGGAAALDALTSTPEAQAVVDNTKSFLDNAIEIGTRTGIIPSKPVSTTEAAADAATGTSEESAVKAGEGKGDTGSFMSSVSTPVLVGGAALVALLAYSSMKGKK